MHHGSGCYSNGDQEDGWVLSSRRASSDFMTHCKKPTQYSVNYLQIHVRYLKVNIYIYIYLINSNQAQRHSFRLPITSECMQTYIDWFLNGLHTRVKMDFLTWMYRGFLKNPHGNRPLAMANAEHLTAAAEAIHSVCTSHSYQATPVGVTLENFHI